MNMAASQARDSAADGIPSKINVSVKNQDGREVFFRICASAQLEKLMVSYCYRESKVYTSVAFVFDGRFLRGEQTPDEVGMKDGDEIYAYDAQSLMRTVESSTSQGVQEGLNAESGPVIEQERRDNDTCERENLDCYTFDELEQGATHNFMQAMSFFKASFHKARRYAEDTRKLSINDETKAVLCEVFDAKAATEKMLADRNLMIGQIHEELGQANAEISALSRNHLQLGEELMNVTKELTSSKEEYARLCEEVEDTRGAAIKESHYGPISTNKSPVHEDAAQPDTADKEETKQPTYQAESINFKVIGQNGTPVFFKTRKSTGLFVVMQAYCSRERKDLDSMRFLFNGCLLQGEQTPHEVQMGDGDEIHAVLNESCGL